MFEGAVGGEVTRGVVCDWMYVRVRSAVVKTELKLQIHTESVCSQSHILTE